MNRRDFFRLFTATGISVAIPGGLAPALEETRPTVSIGYGGFPTFIPENDTVWYAFYMMAPDGWHMWLLDDKEEEIMRDVNNTWLPCGNRNNFASINDIPLYDVPCPCGNPNHWLVKCITTVDGLPQP